MARTYRRRNCAYDYDYVLWDLEPVAKAYPHHALRQRLARFHSDSFASHRKQPPRRLRKADDRKIRQYNRATLMAHVRLAQVERFFRDTRRCVAWVRM
jgi:hypothetical protein